MSKKQNKSNQHLQTSLVFEMPVKTEAAKISAPSNIFVFPAISKKTEEFRERIIKDLIRTRVIAK